MKGYEICFSPTGGTRKAADLLAEPLFSETVPVDLTDSQADFSTVVLRAEDVAVIAVPSYGGRVPATAVQRLSAVRGNGARAVLVCVYGNRAYEDTLAELQDTAKQAGFRVVAAVAAVAFTVRTHKPLVQAVAEHIFPVHDLNQIHQRNIMQILYQPAAALGSADNFDVSGPFHFLGNFICKLPRYELFIADFPDVFQPQVN